MRLCDDLQRYEMEHGMDCPHDLQFRHGRCSYCGEYIEQDDRYFRGTLLPCGTADAADASDVLLHKECFMEYILDKYSEAELASALGLKEVP